VKIDFEKLIVAGHSFGAQTCISVAARDPRVKACLALDPFLLATEPEILNGTLKVTVPICVINSENYHSDLYANKNFDSWKCVKTFCDKNTSLSIENVTIKTSTHFDMFDLMTLMPLEFMTTTKV